MKESIIKWAVKHHKDKVIEKIDVKSFYDKHQDAILKYQDEQRAKSWKENCKYVISFGGHDYYSYKSSDLIPIMRHGLITDQLVMNSKKLTKGEQDLLINGLLESTSKMVNTYNEKKRVEYLHEVHFCALELSGRDRDLMFHPEIMLEIVALSVIRDDEDPTKYDERIHREKMEVFKTEGGAIPFYCQVGLGELCPDWNGSIEQSKELLEKQTELVNLRSSIYKKIAGKGMSTETDKSLKTG